MQRFLIFSLLFLFSCGHGKDQKIKEPDDLIPEEKMVLVLADVHLLEASLAVRSTNPVPVRMRLPQQFLHDSVPPPIQPIGEKKNPLPYYDIFKKNGVTKKQYEESMMWYSANPEKLNALYDEVIIELTKRQTEDRTGKKAVAGDSLQKK
jgi:hypothetical protein